MFALVLAVFLAACNADLPIYCPLCGDGPVLQPPPEPNGGVVNFAFGICCPFADTRGERCIVDPTGEAERTTGLDTAIIESLQMTPEQMQIILSNAIFETSTRSPCCKSCTCFGDPNCISFDGTKETWVVCDGRQIRTNPKKQARGYCPITNAQCSKELDPYGRRCVWGPDKLKIKLQNWDMKKLGSPCQPHNESILTMYIADTFEFRIGQGERGNIISVYLTLGEQEYTLRANRCVNKGRQDSWIGAPINDHFERTVLPSGPHGNEDIVWSVFDPATGISAAMRCTSYLHSGKRYQARIDVESILEPDQNYKHTRAQLGGFCATNDLGNKNPSSNTQSIEKNGLCWQNAPEEDVKVARVICQNPALRLNAVEQCYRQFCNQFWRPYYHSFDACFDVVSNISDEKHWHNGFCKAFTYLSDDYFECTKMIDDYGWEAAVNSFFYRDHVSTECVSNFAQFPDSLDACDQSVELQYLNSTTGKWITVKAIPQKMPPCSDAVFELDFEDFPQLFLNQIRWFQRRELTDCLIDKCSRQDGFSIDMRIELVTAAPTVSTFEPTLSPSKRPTAEPTIEPSAHPSLHPTARPSLVPTESPSSLPPTSSYKPDPLPTPSPIFFSTASPSGSPTGSPFPFYSFCKLEDIRLINLYNSTLLYNNLGGQGPNFDENRNSLPSRFPVIWYHHVFTLQGKWIDVVIHNLSTYEPSNLNVADTDGVSNNGKYFELGQVNLRCGTNTLLEYIFLDADCAQNKGTNFNPVIDKSCDHLIQDMEWTVYDLDHHYNGDNTESAIICPALIPVPFDSQVVQIEGVSPQFCNGETGYEFTAVTFGSDADNPRYQDLQKLSLDQITKVGRVLLKDSISRFKAQYSLTGPDPSHFRPRCGRRILFGGTICDQPIE